MSTPEISQVLAQMRILQAQATTGNVAPTAQPEGNFKQLLTDSINAVNETQHAAKDLKVAFEQGQDDVDLAQVMIAVEKSSVSFTAMVEVRNKLVEAYKDVMNMPV